MSKTKMLFITRVVPSLNGTGAQRRCARHIVALHTLFNINLVILRRETKEVELENAIGSLCQSSCIQYISGFSHQQHATFSLPFSSPIHAVTSIEQEVNVVSTAIKRFEPEHIFAFKLNSARIFENSKIFDLVKDLKKTFDLDDIESKARYRFALASKKKIGSKLFLMGLIESLKLRRIESKAFNCFNNTLICSSTDQKELKKRQRQGNFVIIPNVVDEVNALSIVENTTQTRLLFVGTMQYGPNNEAAIHFVKNIFPFISTLSSKKFILDIVGYHPSEEILSFAKDPCIFVHGGVNSVEPYYQQADLVIAPILTGGGTRIKILEAIMFGRPVISTTIGAEGLDLVNKKEILLADNPKNFAQAIIELSENKAMANDININAIIKLEKLYTQNALFELYKTLFYRLTE